MDEFLKKKTVLILSSAFGLQTNDVEISRDDVPLIASIAYKHKIIPIVVEGIKNLGCSDLLSDELLNGEAKAVFDYTQRKVSLDEISDAFEKASIAYIPLKGSVLRDLYPQPWMRTSSDIDVLIKKEDLDNAIQVIESDTSFRFLRRDLHDIHFINEYVHLELHFTLEGSVERINVGLCNPWENVIHRDEMFRYDFTPDYNLFYIVFHAAKHFIRNGGIGIRPLLDIYVLKTHYVYNESIVESRCEKAGILAFYKSCCKLINIWFNGDTHDDISRDFEDLVISGGIYGSKHLKIISNIRRDSGKKYISGRIFKTREELSNYYPKCRKYPFLVPYYQVVRWTKVLISNKSKAYLSEFKQADVIDQSEVEKYDRLMKAMGL